MRQPAERLTEMVLRDQPRSRAIQVFLDGLPRATRVEALTSLVGPRLQSQFYGALVDAPRVKLVDLVPPEVPPLREVVFQGKNSGLGFSFFQTRFCRPSDRGDMLWGFHRRPLAWLTGPGYFVVQEGEDGATMDYREVPRGRCGTWPILRSNDRGLSRFVYGGMVDHIRRAAQDVFIGAAHRDGRATGNYFMLWR